MATVIANLYRTYIFDKPLQGIIAPYDRRMSEIMNYVAERGIKRLVVSFDCLQNVIDPQHCTQTVVTAAEQAVHAVIHITQIWQHSM